MNKCVSVSVVPFFFSDNFSFAPCRGTTVWVDIEECKFSLASKSWHCIFHSASFIVTFVSFSFFLVPRNVNTFFYCLSISWSVVFNVSRMGSMCAYDKCETFPCVCEQEHCVITCGISTWKAREESKFLVFLSLLFFFQKDLNCFDERGDRNRQGACLEQLLRTKRSRLLRRICAASFFTDNWAPRLRFVKAGIFTLQAGHDSRV